MMISRSRRWANQCLFKLKTAQGYRVCFMNSPSILVVVFTLVLSMELRMLCEEYILRGSLPKWAPSGMMRFECSSRRCVQGQKS